MRIRSTRPHFWRSKRIASVSWDARLVLKGLESYVDDNGVGKDDIALIVGDLFQRDLIREPSRTVARVSEAISELSQAGLLWRYEDDGTHLLYISFWEECQRIDKPQTGRFPRPDGTLNYKDSAIREGSKTLREDSRTVATGVVEEGSRGTEDKEPPYPPDDELSPRQPITTQDGRGKALAKFSREVNTTARSGPAHQIAKAYSDSLTVPIENRLLAQVGVQIDHCLTADIPPTAIAAGLQEWTASDSWSPSQIPNFVHKAANGRKTNGVGKPTQKALGYEDAANQLLAELGVTQ